jgi:hypothetical protein
MASNPRLDGKDSDQRGVAVQLEQACSPFTISRLRGYRRTVIGSQLVRPTTIEVPQALWRSRCPAPRDT